MKPESSSLSSVEESLLSPSERKLKQHVHAKNRSDLFFGLISTFTVSLIIGILIGRNFPAQSSVAALPSPPGPIHQVWEHNLTFSQKPTPESEAAWGSIIPVGRGFIHHDQLAPFISNIAVFHQLHCLVERLPPSHNPSRMLMRPCSRLARHPCGVLHCS